MASILSVSVDLDELASYHQIHGLTDEPGAESRAIWTVAVPRFLKLFESLGVKATFFVVGRSLDAEIGIPALQEIVDAGHEVGNHTFNHYYDLLRRGPAQRRDEVIRGAEAIENAVGLRPRGFRAPGYNIDDELIELLGDLGYAYDSSVFPCPAYYLAKAATLMAYRTRGRQSKSLLGPKEVLLAPAEPYRAGDSFWRRKSRGLLSLARRKKSKQTGLLELPIAVLPGVRSPFIGTTISLGGPRGAKVMALAMLRRRFIGLELHGIDLLDADDQDMSALVEHQPDVKVSLERKTASLEAAVTTLTERGVEALTCFEAARTLAKSGV